MNPARESILATHVITRLIVGGAQENTIATVRGLQSFRGLACNLICGPSTGPEGSLEREFGDIPELLTVTPSLVRPVRPILDLKAFFDLRRIFRRSKPAIVHTHSGKAGIVGRWAARFEKVPLIIHGIHGPSFGPWQSTSANAVFRSVERAAGRVTTHFVAVAEAMIDQYVAAGIGERERYTRIFSGFPLDPYLNARGDQVRERYRLTAEHLVVGKIARITALKGHDDLLVIAPHLVQRFPQIRFLLVGGGSLEEQFRSRVAAEGLERFFLFTGLVPPSEIPALAASMDILVHLSQREGLPRALPQAMAAAKPIVAYDCDGAGEVCLNGKTGFLVALRDYERLCEVLSMLAANRELRNELGQRGRAFVVERFSVEKMVQDTFSLYQRLLLKQGLRL